MRTELLSALILAIAGASAFAVENRDASGEIRAVLEAQVAAWNRGDIDGFMNGYVRSDELEFVSGDKITRGWKTVRDRYRKKYNSREAMGTLKFSELKIRIVNPSLASVVGKWELRRKQDRPHGSFVLTFHHQSEGWRIIRDNTS